MLDVVTLGETMLRLTPPDLRRIEQAGSFEVHVGGSESNVAVGLARLGMRVAWLSALPTNALGRLAAAEVGKHGVNTSHITWVDDARLGLYFLEEGRAPRGSHVIYDRAGSAFHGWEDVPPEPFESGRLLHLSGIAVAQASEGSRRAVEMAKTAGWLLSFDTNYRAKLWSPDEARAACEPFIAQADVLIIPRRDATLLYDATTIEQVAPHSPQATVVMTLGAEGAVGRTPDSSTIKQAAFPAEAVGRVGGGDAFAAGLLYGILTHGALDKALRWGAAAAAFKYSIPGDMPIFHHDEIAALVEQRTTSGLTR